MSTMYPSVNPPSVGAWGVGAGVVSVTFVMPSTVPASAQVSTYGPSLPNIRVPQANGTVYDSAGDLDWGRQVTITGLAPGLNSVHLSFYRNTYRTTGGYADLAFDAQDGKVYRIDYDGRAMVDVTPSPTPAPAITPPPSGGRVPAEGIGIGAAIVAAAVGLWWWRKHRKKA